MNVYPINNLSSFELMVGDFNTGGSYSGGEVFIDFRHKYDSDSLLDGGYITVSWDNGQTWTNIIEDNSTYFQITPHNQWSQYGNTNLYNHTSLLYNGEHGFSGNSGNWVHSCMAWYIIPVNKRIDLPPDTMRLRFNFISDGIHHNHDGWMIDQIRIFALDLGNGIQDYFAGKKHSYFFPNPVETTATFKLYKTCHDVHYELMDGRGTIISKSDRRTCNEFIFDRSGITPGIYIMRLFIDNQFTDFHKIIISQ
jgi:hypothetical protein